MQLILGYFCMVCIVLFFRRLCSTPPEVDHYTFKAARWWVATFLLAVVWPVAAPLAGSLYLGKKAREGIEDHNRKVENG